MRPTIIILIVFSVLLQFCDNAFSRPTTEDEAAKVVVGWLRADPKPLETRLGHQVDHVETFNNNDGEPIYYIVYLQPSGFVIVSADNRVEPIVGFADDGVYDPSLDSPLGALVTNDLNGRLQALHMPNRFRTEALKQQLTQMQSKWQNFISLAESSEGDLNIMGIADIDDPRVSPLIVTKWSQQNCCWDPNLPCYNYYTPQIADGQVRWDMQGDPCNYPWLCGNCHGPVN